MCPIPKATYKNVVKNTRNQMPLMRRPLLMVPIRRRMIKVKKMKKKMVMTAKSQKRRMKKYQRLAPMHLIGTTFIQQD